MELRNRRRLQAVLIAAIFIVPFAVAMLMGLSGWAPRAQSYGEPVRPERDLTGVPVERLDGQAFAWRNDDALWTLVALPGPDCAQTCLRQLDLVHRAQIGLGRRADKLRLLYLGTPPEGDAARGFEEVWMLATTPSQVLRDLRADLPDTVSAVLVTPGGEALTRYAAPFDAAHLGGDLRKAVR